MSAGSSGWGVGLAVLGLIVGAILACFEPIAGIVVLGLVALVVAIILRSNLSVSGVKGWLLLAVPLLAAGAIGWVAVEARYYIVGPRTPPPLATITDPMDPAQRAAVLEYARGLTFAYDTGGYHSSGKLDPYGPQGEYHGQFDRNLLDTFGDSGVLAPEENIHRSRDGDLRRGRIQLRITIIPGPGRAAKDVYATLKLYPGVSYVWVDRLDPARRTARMVTIPADTNARPDTETIHVFPTKRWNQAVARWTPRTCWSCESAGWSH